VRVETIGDCTLYLGDCLEILPTLGKVDAVVTDPPYLVTPTSITHYTKPGMIKGGWMGKEYPTGHGKLFETPDFGEWMAACFCAVKTNGDAYFMTNDRNLSDMKSAAELVGWKWHNLLVWKKPAGIPNRWYFKDCEFTLYLFKGRARTIRVPSSTQMFVCGHTTDRKHPSEKPTLLFEHYIQNSTDIGETILDPFMGSGTTGVACAKLGRKFIGIEIEPRYFDIACERIRKAYEQPDMFIERPKPAKQEALL